MRDDELADNLVYPLDDGRADEVRQRRTVLFGHVKDGGETASITGQLADEGLEPVRAPVAHLLEAVQVVEQPVEARERVLGQFEPLARCRQQPLDEQTIFRRVALDILAAVGHRYHRYEETL